MICPKDIYLMTHLCLGIQSKLLCFFGIKYRKAHLEQEQYFAPSPNKYKGRHGLPCSPPRYSKQHYIVSRHGKYQMLNSIK